MTQGTYTTAGNFAKVQNLIHAGNTSGHTPKKAQAAQPVSYINLKRHEIVNQYTTIKQVPPVSQGGILSSNSHNIACNTSYCPQQVAQAIQNQKVVMKTTQLV